MLLPLFLPAFGHNPSSLESKIPGIVESSIYNVIVIKNYLPGANYDEIIDKLNEISERNPDPAIRVKAHLATIYLNSSDIINVVPKHNVFDHENIFKQITDSLILSSLEAADREEK